MGTTERREREKEYRRKTIIDAAEKVIFTKGYEKSTMDDIAAESELSKGTLYLYFKSKEEVYISIIYRGMKVLRRLFEEAVDSETIGLEKVRAVGEAYNKFHLENRNYYDALMHYSAMEIDIDTLGAAGAELKAFMENKEIMSVLVTALKDGIKDGSVRSDLDPEKTAIILWGQTSGILQLVTTKGKVIKHIYEYTRNEMFTYSMEFAYNALKA